MKSSQTQPLTIAEASNSILNGSLSPAALLDTYLDRIDAIDAQIHSFIHVDAAGARKAAADATDEIAAGNWRGPLHGVPFAVKDNYDAAGLPATVNSKLRIDNVPDSVA